MTRPKGVDQVDGILENDRGRWFEDLDDWLRKRQRNQTLPGYEETTAYRAHPLDVITWDWLDDIA